ncbi:MAG TPA: hypothetical protein VFI17_00805 [Solirubrobacterales bacterium]|nr:hypothetical protein [Solirubrobacterales bacterium]
MALLATLPIIEPLELEALAPLELGLGDFELAAFGFAAFLTALGFAAFGFAFAFDFAAGLAAFGDDRFFVCVLV